jgi:hypothetical protein
MTVSSARGTDFECVDISSVTSLDAPIKTHWEGGAWCCDSPLSDEVDVDAAPDRAMAPSIFVSLGVVVEADDDVAEASSQAVAPSRSGWKLMRAEVRRKPVVALRTAYDIALTVRGALCGRVR